MFRLLFKLQFAALATVLLTSCFAPTRPNNSEFVPPGKVYSGSYIIVAAPNSTGWSLVSSNSAGMAFARRGADEQESFIASVEMFDFPQLKSVQEFESHVIKEISRDLETQRFTTNDFSHELSNERSYPCVRIHNISQDTEAQVGDGATTNLILENIHHYCRHPHRTNTGFVASYSHRGYNQYSNLAPEAELFIQGVQVPERVSE